MAAAASYFSGTALMPSQRSGAPAPEYSAAGTGAAAAPSPSKVRDLPFRRNPISVSFSPEP
jgi:hypothetical protein